jgi:hypothetical protein
LDSHRGTLDARTGHRRGQGDDSTADARTSRALLAERPHAGRPALFLLWHNQAAAGSLHWPGRAATLAGELGLDVAHLHPIGWSATSVPEPTAARYAEVQAELGAALVLWRRAEQAAPVGLGHSRNALACSCGCGRRIRVARSVLELAPILCAACTQPFEPDDDPL